MGSGNTPDILLYANNLPVYSATTSQIRGLVFQYLSVFSVEMFRAFLGLPAIPCHIGGSDHSSSPQADLIAVASRTNNPRFIHQLLNAHKSVRRKQPHTRNSTQSILPKSSRIFILVHIIHAWTASFRCISARTQSSQTDGVSHTHTNGPMAVEPIYLPSSEEKTKYASCSPKLSEGHKVPKFS